MNREDYVSLEAAKLLKEKGFGMYRNVYTEKIQGSEREEWDEDECMYCTVYSVITYPKPTLYEAQKWLREKHNMEVSAAYCRNRISWYYWMGLLSCNDEEVNWGFNFQSYEEALNAGILEALKLI